MLISSNVLPAEQHAEAMSLKDKRQALPQEASFSNLFASMFQRAEDKPVNSEALLDSPAGILPDLEGIGVQNLDSTCLSLPVSDVAVLSSLDGFDIAVNTGVTEGNVLSSLSLAKDEAQSLVGVSQETDSAESPGVAHNIMSLVEHIVASSKGAGDNRLVKNNSNENSALRTDESLLAGLPEEKVLSLEVADRTIADSEVLSSTLVDGQSDEQEKLPALMIDAINNDVVEDGSNGNSEINSLMAGLDSDLNISQMVSEQKAKFGLPESSVGFQATGSVGAEVDNDLAANQIDLKAVAEGVLIASSPTSATNGHSAVSTPQVQNSVGNSNSQSHAQWGASGSETQQTSANSANSNQSFSQGASQQQNPMMQAQVQRMQGVEQQMVVKATDELMAKADVKEGLLGTDLLSSDRRVQLPLGMQSIALPIKSPQWGQALGQRVVYMANNQLQQANITLNPDKLGPVQVKLHMDKDKQVHVTMTAHHATTREAMDNALPKLREMMEQAGIDLGSLDVGDDRQFAEDMNSQSGSSSVHVNSEEQDSDLKNEMSSTQVVATDNIVDFYA